MKMILWLSLLVFSSCSGFGIESESRVLESEMPGAMFARNTEKNTKFFLPLKKTNVKLWVSPGIVHAEVSQVFTNDTAYPLEAIYIFPLPSRSTVTEMTLKVGERIIRSVVKEREEAKKTFEKAKREGKKAALIEEERPNIFTTSVANFLPGETVEVQISYIEPTDFKKGTYEVNFPMVIGPRYIPFDRTVDDDASSPVPDADRISPPILHPNIDSGHRLNMEVFIEGLPLKEIISNTHAIKVDTENDDKDAKYLVTLKNSETIPNCDFNIKLNLRRSEQPEISVLNSVKDKQVYGMINLFPPDINDDVGEESEIETLREIIFLIDTSGSMSGESITQAKSGLKHCVKMLREEDRFTIVRFSDNFSSFSPDLRKGSEETSEAAIEYVQGLSADGGTEMQKALKYVLDIPGGDENAMRIIVFLTDGDVGDENRLIRLLSNKLGKTRLFTFAIGSAPNEYLMRQMAEKGRGQFRSIHSHEDIGIVMRDFFATLEKPILTDIKLSWLDRDGFKVDDIVVYPEKCPDLFHERAIRLFAKFSSNAVEGLRITGKLAGKIKTYDFPIKIVENTSYPAIEKLFAQCAINKLMYKLIMNPESKEEVKNSVIDIALRHQLVSKFTSRVAVEEKVEKKPDGTLVSVKVPVELPKGWQINRFAATATNHPLLSLIGAISVFLGLIVLCIRRQINNSLHH